MPISPISSQMSPFAVPPTVDSSLQVSLQQRRSRWASSLVSPSREITSLFFFIVSGSGSSRLSSTELEITRKLTESLSEVGRLSIEGDRTEAEPLMKFRVVRYKRLVKYAGGTGANAFASLHYHARTPNKGKVEASGGLLVCNPE